MTARRPRSGDTLRVTRAASVQFTSPMYFRVIRVHDWTTYDGWVWLDGYELTTSGQAVERRSIFVQFDGLQYVGPLSNARRARSRPAVPVRRSGTNERKPPPPPGE